MSIELMLLYGEKPFYEELYFEGYLNKTFNEKIILEGFRFGNPFVNKGIEIIRETELGRESGIKAKYVRRLNKDWKNINNWEDVMEKVEFLKDSNCSVFIKGKYGLKIRFDNENSNYIRKTLKETFKEFKSGAKKRLHLESGILGDEAITTFRSHMEMTENIFLTYKALHDYLISKDL